MNIKALILLILLPLALFPQGENHYLYYRLQGATQPQAVLFSIRGNQTVPVDTAGRQSNGSYVFFDIDSLPPGVYSVYFSDSLFTELIINGETIVLEANKDNIIQTMEVKKSVENAILFNYWRYVIAIRDSINKIYFDQQKVLKKNNGYENATSRAMQTKIDRLNDGVYDYVKQVAAAYPRAFAPKLLLAYQLPSYRRYLSKEDNEPYADENEFLFYHFFDYIDFSDPRMLNTKVLYLTLSDYMERFTSPPSTSTYNRLIDLIMPMAAANEEVRLYFLNLFIQNFDNTIWEDVFVHLIDRYLAPYPYPNPAVADYYIRKARIIKSLKPGKKAPPLVLPDTAGRPVDVMKIKARAKMLLFYASDCSHCEEAMPGLKAIAEQYRSKGLKVIGIALDDDEQLWKSHLLNDSLPWLSLSDLKGMASPLIERYNIRATPYILILNKKNIIMKKPRGLPEIHATLTQLLY